MPNISFEHIPGDLMGCMMQTEHYVNALGIVDMSVMELLRYYVSILNGCAYCVDMHFKEAVAAGETEQRLYSVGVWQDTDFYSDSERALLAWTAFVTKLDSKAEEKNQLFRNLNQFYSVADIANLTLAIVQINSWVRLAKPLGFVPGSYQVGHS